jgi:phosphoribosylanthranilate isomerase
VAAAVEAGANAIGFVFAPSPREIAPEDALALCASVPRGVARVAVMHHPEPERWRRVLGEFAPDWLQTDAADLRGIDLPPQCTALPVYREGHTPFSRRKGDNERRDAGDAADDTDSTAVDASDATGRFARGAVGDAPPKSGPRSSADDSEDSVRTVSLRHALPPRLLFEGTQSGTGRASDWDEARALARATQLVLAGGLHSGNVAAAIVRVRPFGVDVSSGVERTRGRKDPAMIKEFVARVRALEVS